MQFRFPTGSYPLGRTSRVLVFLWGTLLAAGFFLARSLEPDPRGFGTHQRMGFPPCTFLTMTGLPCPSCGMTTCFAHFTRGQLRQAFAANPPGVLVAILSAIQIPWCLWSAVSGRLWGVNRPGDFALWVMIVVGGICLAYWIVKIVPWHSA